MAVCASYLSRLEVYDEDVTKTNMQQLQCSLFPIANFLSSGLILKISILLDNPNLCQLADEETPTSDSGHLHVSGHPQGVVDEEAEDYNDISSKFVLVFL